ncbi:MAG: hypothetical protein QW385_03335 [Thermoproteota archaeon]
MSLSLQGLDKTLYPLFSELQKLEKRLNAKTTLELGIEKSITDSGAKLAILSSLHKAEVETKECKRFGMKRRRVEVKNYEDFVKALESYAKISNLSLTPEQVYFALKDLEKGAEGELKDKIRALRKEVGKREGIHSKRIVYGAALGIIALASLGGLYYQFVFKPEQERQEAERRAEQARRPYKQAGLTQEQADSFIFNHPGQNGNSTWVSFAKSWVEDQSLVDSAFQTFKDLNKALEYLSLSNNKQLLSSALQAYGNRAGEFVNFAESNNYDGVNFLAELSMIKEIYRDALPLYSSNSSLVKAVWDQVSRDNRISDKLSVASKAFSLLRDSGIRSLNCYTIHVPGNYSAALLEGYPGADFEKAFETLLKDTKAADIRQIQIIDMNGEFGYLPEKIDYKRAFWLLLSLLERIGEPQTTGEEVATRVAAYQYDLSEAGFSKQEIVEKALRLYQLVPKIGSRLVQNIQSEDERRIVEYYKAQAPLLLYDFKTDKYYDDKEAVEVFIKRLEEGVYDGDFWKHLESIKVNESEVYEYVLKNGFPLSLQKYIELVKPIEGNPTKEDLHYLWVWWQWKSDRAYHGLKNAVLQSVRVDRYLEEVYPTWSKIKRIYDHVISREGEWKARRGGLKIVFTLLDEPIAYANPVHNFTSERAGGEEFGIFGIPDQIAQPIKQGLYGRTIILPGNGISLGSMIEGIEKDFVENPLTYSSLMLPYKFKSDYEWLFKGIYLYEKLIPLS